MRNRKILVLCLLSVMICLILLPTEALAFNRGSNIVVNKEREMLQADYNVLMNYGFIPQTFRVWTIDNDYVVKAEYLTQAQIQARYAIGSYLKGFTDSQVIHYLNTNKVELTGVWCKIVTTSNASSYQSRQYTLHSPYGIEHPLYRRFVQKKSHYLNEGWAYFGKREMEEGGKWVIKTHYGIDYVGSAKGTPLYAVESGTIIWKNEVGKTWKGYHAIITTPCNTTKFEYYHMNGIPSGKSFGLVYSIKAGELVGYEGGSGASGLNAYGSHLHYQHRIGSSTTDPNQYLHFWQKILLSQYDPVKRNVYRSPGHPQLGQPIESPLSWTSNPPW